MMAEKHFVVIGNGPAGQEAAFTLRDKDPGCRITVISREAHRCYRPHLLPRFVAGHIMLADLYMRPLEAYSEAGIRLRLGQSVTRVDLKKKQIHLSHNEVVGCDGLILATGGTPRIPERFHVFKDLLLTLKTIEDAQHWMESLQKVEEVAIIGGDLTSLGFTRALLEIGKKVSFAFNQDAFWPLRSTSEAYEQASAGLSEKGVNCIPGKLRSIVKHDDYEFELVTDECSTRAGLVGGFFGLRPEVGFLAGSGLVVERGVLVDEYLNAGAPGVFAAGDCAQIYSPELKDYWVSIGYQNALTLGKFAALNLSGSAKEVHADLNNIFSDEGVKINTSWWAEF
jgi:NAD(P)H-nitrite reductase large subunit